MALTAGCLLLGMQLLMGDSLAPGCSSSDGCGNTPAVDLTFAVSGDCSEPGTVHIVSGAGVCQLTVTGHPAWRGGFRGSETIESGRWELTLEIDGAYGGRCKVTPGAAAGEHRLDCDRLDGGACSSILRPIP